MAVRGWPGILTRIPQGREATQRAVQALDQESVCCVFLVDCRLIHDCVVSGDFLDCEGSGLYPLHSHCAMASCAARILVPLTRFAGNHSCVPNAEVKYPNNDFTLHLFATKPIAAGEVSGA